jgi:uncharacterized protein
LDVVELFAVFHDSCRISDGHDIDHGNRGADLAASFRGTFYDLADEKFSLLHTACALHTDGETKGDITVLTCWDADRLDLPRVGITPKAGLLCTDAARQSEMMRWCAKRAARNLVPSLVHSDWDLDRP